jgi:integrase
MLSTLTFAGLRIGELLALRWRDVDLAGGWLTVGDAKTDAGRRKVKVRGALNAELVGVGASLVADGGSTDPDAYVFPTRTGRRMNPENVRNRILAAAVKRADEQLAERGLSPLPESLTPHSLRRTFCSLLYALGESPPVVMQEMGHTHPGLCLRVYAQAMRRGEDEKAALRALVAGAQLADIGIRAADAASVTATGAAKRQ